jgi:polysaccharide deacetylase family protein (PEP-CTERM system associated)
MQKQSVTHFFTVDVEEHFQVSAFEGLVSRDDWASMPSRVVGNTERVLRLLETHQSTATFFVLGWVAEKHPSLVRTVLSAGHEVASHGYAHRRVTDLTPEEFRNDVRLAKAILEDAGGVAVLGYRAPSFSIVPGLEWAFEVLLEEGHLYDSSLFPIRRRGYGYADAVPIPHVLHTPAGHLFEFPMLTTCWAGIRLPASGGAYFRQLPYALTRRALREHEQAQLPGMFYIHPWEIDPDQPRLNVPVVTTLRHYRGLQRTQGRLERLLREFAFCPIASRLPDIPARTDAPVSRQLRVQ